jgi:hypothetical protein
MMSAASVEREGGRAIRQRRLALGLGIRPGRDAADLLATLDTS